jgi:hypothetical protein
MHGQSFSVISPTIINVQRRSLGGILVRGGRSMISIMTWAIVPLLAAAQISTPAPATCPVTTPVRATAPADPNADPVSGYWHISADRQLWAPAPPIGTPQTGIGRYWVRPAGTQLTFIARRLDVPGPPITSGERSEYPTGFYFGTVDIPTEGCWEVTARAGGSQVTFVTEIQYPIDRFARQPGTRVAWSKEIGTIENGTTRLVVTAMSLEDARSVTRRARGIRIDLTDGVVSDQLWESDRRLAGTRGILERWASGMLPMIYGLGQTHNAKGDESGLAVIGKDHQYSFPGRHQPAELTRFFLQALEELNAHAP